MIELIGVYKNFGEKEVLRNVGMTIRKGEIFTLIGPSGTGKSTILRLINLLDVPTEGEIFFEGIDTSGPEKTRLQLRRRMSMVFQKPAALRGDVFDNIAAPLMFRKVPVEDIRKRVPEALELVGLSGYESRRASTLSGGEMQRVAIARAIVTRPEVLLLDEPTANLDPVSTEKVENLVHTINSRFGTTIILSTHDMAQGQRLAHRIAVVLSRTIGQTGTAHEIFYQPRNRDVAHMVGVENILEGMVKNNEEGLALIDIEGYDISATSDCPTGSRVTAYIRPEDLVLSTVEFPGSSLRNRFLGRITKVVAMGPMVKVRIDCGIRLISVITKRSFDELEIEEGGSVHVYFKASAVHVVRID